MIEEQLDRQDHSKEGYLDPSASRNDHSYSFVISCTSIICSRLPLMLLWKFNQTPDAR